MRRIAWMGLGVALLLSGVPLYSQANAGLEKTLEAKEQIGWQAWKDHKAPPALEEMTPEDSINIADGIVSKGKEQILHAVVNSGCEVGSFSLSDFSFMWLDKDTVLMFYTATQDATCSGKKQAGKVLATSLWQKKGGKWVSPFHQETDADNNM